MYAALQHEKHDTSISVELILELKPEMEVDQMLGDQLIPRQESRKPFQKIRFHMLVRTREADIFFRIFFLNFFCGSSVSFYLASPRRCSSASARRVPPFVVTCVAIGVLWTARWQQIFRRLPLAQSRS